MEGSEPQIKSQYLYPPTELTQGILEHVNWRRENGKDWPADLAPVVDKLLYYNELLIDFTQAQELGEMGGRGALYQGYRVQQVDHTKAGYVRYHISVIHIYLYM